MQITIINGISEDLAERYGAHETALEQLVKKLSEEHTVHLFTPRRLKLSFCCGCFHCWVKTPGRCVFQDDMEPILKSLSNADLTLYVSPLKTGFVTSETKKVMDRIIPTALPYVRVFQNECHHPRRYEKEGNMGLVLLKEDGLEGSASFDVEAAEITQRIFSRLAINKHSKKFLNRVVTSEEIGGLKDEICRS